MVRKIVKFFKFSPKRNSILQEYVKDKHGIELSLLLDCKTRWNSIVTMIERFLKIVDSVRNALNDLGSLTLLNENAMAILSNIFNALQPFKLAAEALGRRDANLVTADAILKFLFDTLRANDDNISTELLEVLSRRVKERRNKDLVSLAKYLKTLDLQSTATAELPSSSKSSTIRYAIVMFNKLFSKEVQSEGVGTEMQSENSSGEDNEHVLLVPDINDRLAGAINEALKTKKLKSSNHPTKNIQTELQIYESTGNITANLQKLLDALLTIQATSIESERVFSASSNFCSKKRSSLSDFSLDCLSFLKSYFLNK